MARSVLDVQHTLDPDDWGIVRELGHTMIDDMIELLRTVRSRPAWQPVLGEVRERFARPLPADPTDARRVYDEFRESVQPFPTGNIHPRFWGWVMGTGSVTGALAEFLSGALDGNAIGGDQASTYLELQVLDWIRQMLGVDSQSSGILVDGGSVANLVGITAARQARAGLDLDGYGVSGDARVPVLYCSTETHNSVAKAVTLLGLGKRAMRFIPTTPDYRIDVAALHAGIRADRAAGLRPFCVVGNAGTVNTGAFDDLNALADIAGAEELWLHVDGAFGAFAAIGESVRSLVSGMERADSIAVDLHKWLHMPYDVGCAFVRDSGAHRASFAQNASYLDPQARGFAAGSHWFAEYGPQLSRGNRALKVWMELKTHGARRYGELVDQNVRQARYLADLIEASPALELAAPVPLNVVCFRMKLAGASAARVNAANKELLLRIQESGVAMPSSTVLEGAYVIRVAITNHRTCDRDLEIFVEAASMIAQSLAAEALTPSKPADASRVRVVDYRPAHRDAFRDLNLDWITRFFAVEEADEIILRDPERYVIDRGGAILIAELDGIAVGACALVREDDGRYEMAKMAVAEQARGLGIGRALANAVIARARLQGVRELELFTNSRLGPAVALYRSLGFVDVPIEHNQYARADIRMVLPLGAAAPDRSNLSPCINQ